MTAYRNDHEYLVDELRRLDVLIGVRLAAMNLRNEAYPHDQAARTVYITRQEVDWLLAGDGEVTIGVDRATLDQFTALIDARVGATAGLRLPALGRLCGLSAWELLAVVVCLAPELRRKYDRLYAYLQDDITRRRPSVDLVLELLCDNEEERWAAGGAFAENAPLLRHGILRTVDDPQSPSGSSGLARFLALDPRILRFLLGEDGLDPRLGGHARCYDVATEGLRPDPVLGDRLARLVAQRPDAVCYLHGPAGVGKLELARYASHRMGLPLVSLDAATLAGSDAEVLLRLAFREARLHDASLHIAHADSIPGQGLGPALRAAADDFGRPVFLAGESDRAGFGLDVHPVAVPLPGLRHSITLWRDALAGHTADVDRRAAELAGRYRLTPARIRAAVRSADNERLMLPECRPLTLADLSLACRQQSNQALGQVAVKVSGRAGWDDLVLPADRVAQLRDICGQVRHRDRVLNGWGFGSKLSHGAGLSVLFSGPPGTGKTMAAEVLARELEVDLYKVDLSGVVSKYIGETEKNLARIFAEARTSNAILFFDEADALFGKRTEISDAHDRYANIETSYLLQQMEEYDGVVLLATNLRQNIDDAFTRRIRFVVEFPFPEVADRRRIWETFFPSDAPVSADVDFARLAKEFAVTGANIRNIVVNAAFLAAADGGVIDRRHVLRGTRQEFEKIGKLWSETS